MVRIGFLGIQCDNANLGVSALAYAGIRLVHGLTPQEAEFVIFSDSSAAGIERMKQALGMTARSVRAVPFRHRSPRRMATTVREIAGCDVVIDFTGGDSFSDIYGVPRIAKLLFHKDLAIVTRTPLVLAPQTYGPFSRKALLPWVRHVLRRAELVFSRDEPSAEYLASIVKRDVVLTTDVAVTLPWERAATSDGTDSQLRVGFNVSGLLWRGGYSGGNQFGLRGDYQEFCHKAVDALLAAGFAVDLVPHVVPSGDLRGEDDMAACVELHASHPETTVAPEFRTPVEAKSYISGFDAFLGARMHATIGAFTAGVPTIPLAYSRKFAGLFGSLGYDVAVDLRAMDADEAVAATMQYLTDLPGLRAQVAEGNAEAKRRITAFTDGLGALFTRLGIAGGGDR